MRRGIAAVAGVLLLPALAPGQTLEKRAALGAQVMIVSGKPGRWVVSVAFGKAIQRPQLEQRYRKVESVLNARCGAVQMDTRKGISTMTFATAARLVDVPSGTVVVEPFVQALGDLGVVGVTFGLPETFSYQGQRHGSVAGRPFSVTAEKGWVSILAGTTETTGERKAARPGPRTPRGALVGWLLALGAAAGGGVYFLTRRLVQR